VKREAGIATRTVELIATPKQAEAIVRKSDMVALVRMLDNPHWGWHAAPLGEVVRPAVPARRAQVWAGGAAIGTDEAMLALPWCRPAMDAFVFAAVLFAAACRTGWDATIKRGLDRLQPPVLISLGAAVVSAAAAGRRLAGGRRTAVVRRLGGDPPLLFRALIEAIAPGIWGESPHRTRAFPLMTLTTGFVGGRLGLPAWCGIILLAVRSRVSCAADEPCPARSQGRLRPLPAVTICAYSVVDSLGARLASSANAYRSRCSPASGR
jgi:hypothetical protein